MRPKIDVMEREWKNLELWGNLNKALRRIAHMYTYCIWHVNLFIHPSVAHLFYSAFQIKSAWSGRPASDWWSTGQWNERYLLPAIQTANRVRQQACQATGQCAFATRLEVQLSLLSTKFVCVALCNTTQGRDDFNFSKTYMNTSDKTNCVLASMCVPSHCL